MRTLAVLVTALALAACGGSGGGDGTPTATPSSPRVALTLPPGALSGLAVQPTDVPDGLTPILAQTGPADVKRIASFSADPAAAERSLTEHGFTEAYVATYGDPQTGRVLSSVVTRFASVSGATADLTADIESGRSGGTPFEVSGLGDQAAGVTGKLKPAEGTGELVTLRWRVGETTFLLAVGAPGTVDRDGAVALAKRLAERVQ